MGTAILHSGASSPGIVSPQIMTTRYLNTNYIQFGTTFEGTKITNPVVYATDNQFDVS